MPITCCWVTTNISACMALIGFMKTMASEINFEYWVLNFNIQFVGHRRLLLMHGLHVFLIYHFLQVKPARLIFVAVQPTL